MNNSKLVELFDQQPNRRSMMDLMDRVHVLGHQALLSESGPLGLAALHARLDEIVTLLRQALAGTTKPESAPAHTPTERVPDQLVDAAIASLGWESLPHDQAASEPQPSTPSTTHQAGIPGR